MFRRPAGCFSATASQRSPEPDRWWVRPRRSIRFCPRIPVAADGRGVRRLRPGFHRSHGFIPAQRPFAVRYCANRDQPLRRAGGHDRRAIYPAGDVGRSGYRRGERFGRQSVGRVHHRQHHNHCSHHGPVDVVFSTIWRWFAVWKGVQCRSRLSTLPWR